MPRTIYDSIKAGALSIAMGLALSACERAASDQTRCGVRKITYAGRTEYSGVTSPLQVFVDLPENGPSLDFVRSDGGNIIVCASLDTMQAAIAMDAHRAAYNGGDRSYYPLSVARFDRLVKDFEECGRKK